MSPLVLGALVVLLILCALAWLPALRTPLAWASALGLIAVLVVPYVAGAALPADPQLAPWGVVVCVVVAAIGGGPVASAVLSAVKKTADADARRELAEEYSSAELAAMAADARSQSVSSPAPQLRGGKWIGVLERLAVAGTLVAGYPAGVAVVLAVKALGRYPELQAGNAERFIIGTFVSLLWALGAVGVPLIGAA